MSDPAPTITLHQWEISPFCGKVRKALRAKGLTFETVNYNGMRARSAAGLTPTGKLPVIDYKGERIQDSSRIIEYLERTHPEPALYPKSPRERHMAHVFEDWADESLYWFEIYLRFAYPDSLEKAADLLAAGRPGWERTLMKPVLRRMYKKKLHAQGLGRMSREQVESAFFQHLDHLEGLLDGQDWLVGATQSIADIAVTAQLDEIARTSHLTERMHERPRLKAWLVRSAS